MAVGSGRSEGGRQAIARGFFMRDSSSTTVFLPFGALTGVIPVDSIARERTLGDFSSVLSGRPMSEVQRQFHSVIHPVSPERAAGIPAAMLEAGECGI